MFKNLDPNVMGLSCSQSELIELTLTHGFRGLHIDFDSFFAQVTSRGIDHAIRYLKSAPVKITTTELPIDWYGDDVSFAAELERLPKILDQITPLACQAMVTNVMPGCNVRPYHENFEMHRTRLAQIAEVVAAKEMRLGIGFEIPFDEDGHYANPFIKEPEALVTLLKTCDAHNLALVIDAWRWTVAGGAFRLLAGLAPNQILDVRLSDLPADWNPNRLREEDRLLYGETGAVDGSELLEILGELDYRGAITPSAAASQFTEVRNDAAVKKASASLDQFLMGPRKQAEEEQAADSDGTSSEDVAQEVSAAKSS